MQNYLECLSKCNSFIVNNIDFALKLNAFEKCIYTKNNKDNDFTIAALAMPGANKNTSPIATLKASNKNENTIDDIDRKSMEQRCFMCGIICPAKPQFYCHECRRVEYCSAKCQIDHTDHELDCKILKKLHIRRVHDCPVWFVKGLSRTTISRIYEKFKKAFVASPIPLLKALNGTRDGSYNKIQGGKIKGVPMIFSADNDSTLVSSIVDLVHWISSSFPKGIIILIDSYAFGNVKNTNSKMSMCETSNKTVMKSGDIAPLIIPFVNINDCNDTDMSIDADDVQQTSELSRCMLVSSNINMDKIKTGLSKTVYYKSNIITNKGS